MRYGSPITMELKQSGVTVSRGTIARLMRENGIKAKTVKKFKVTTDSNHSLPVAPNILNHDFSAEYRDQKYVSDITYIWTDEEWLYLAGLLDLYDGALVGWSMDIRMKKSLVIAALESACLRKSPAAGLLLHSDRGSQYCSEAYQKEIKKRGFILLAFKCYMESAKRIMYRHQFSSE
ncbi:MAG: IS3 family transposase [Spirochaetes bacterium]|jgi:putative transposase|nr:IS3 family transposase [Spirochaetota bacterium]